MSKTLSTILTIFKVASIVAKVIFILCIVGAAGCTIAICTLPLIKMFLPSQILIDEGIDLASSLPACVVSLIACAGEGVFAFMAEKYFGNVLNAGTPFTHNGAKESFRLGLASIIISVVISIVAGITIGILTLILSNPTNLDVEASFSISTGLFFMFMSLIFKHGAELQESKTEEQGQEKSSSDENIG